MNLHHATFVSAHAESMIFPLWNAGKNTNEIARALGLPEAEIANRLPLILERRRGGVEECADNAGLMRWTPS